MPVLIARLKFFESAGASMEEESLINLVEKLSYPVEFVFLRVLIILVISDSEMDNEIDSWFK